jgi:hypothetical protein
MIIIKHICKNGDSRSWQKITDWYVEIQVRIFKSGTRYLYMWKPYDDVGFVIQFCPFCGVPSKELCNEFPEYQSRLIWKDIPLENRKCPNCFCTEFRELTNTSLPLAICLNCSRIGTLY